MLSGSGQVTGTKSARARRRRAGPLFRVVNPEIQNVKKGFIEAAGNLTQSIGLGRALGQVFAHIYFSKAPQTLDDITHGLGISKGSASMTVRQLEQWGALRRLWIKGERKDFYETTESFGRIIRKALLDTIGRRMESSDALLENAERTLKQTANGRKPDDDAAFVEGRIKRLRLFRTRVQRLWDSSLLSFLLK